MKYILRPDFFCTGKRTEYGALFGSSFGDVSIEDLSESINDGKKIGKPALYSSVQGDSTDFGNRQKAVGIPLSIRRAC